MGEATTETTKPAGLTDEEENRLTKLFGPAQAGDKKALAELRPLIERAGM